jgi:hypothetical protein
MMINAISNVPLRAHWSKQRRGEHERGSKLKSQTNRILESIVDCQAEPALEGLLID